MTGQWTLRGFGLVAYPEWFKSTAHEYRNFSYRLPVINPRGLHRAEHLLADPDHPVGEVPVRSKQGHNSIACFSVDTATGELTANGIVPSEPIPNALCLGLGDRFIYSAGHESGQMATFSVNPDSGELTRVETTPLGNNPGWISVVELPR